MVGGKFAKLDSCPGEKPAAYPGGNPITWSLHPAPPPIILDVTTYTPGSVCY